MKKAAAIALCSLLLCPSTGSPQVGSTFTYQGRLTDAALPANGTYDFEVKLFDALTVGTQIGPTLTLGDIGVANGLFTVSLDFGAAAFTGSKRWLEIGVRPGISTGVYTVLSPRQELTPSPNAVFSATAATVTGVVPIANGGTGSATQNFVDLTSAQTVGGDKTLTGNLVLGASTATSGSILKGGTLFIHNFGINNTFIGEGAGNVTMTGSNNTAEGAQALQSNTTGGSNTASGRAALQNNTTGGSNTASGASALLFNTTGGGNTASGTNALLFNTTGSNNTASGVQALQNNSAGLNNTASGAGALQNNTTGDSNTASGVGALQSNTTGVDSAAIGANALRDNTTGCCNAASGYNALSSNTTGFNNTAGGYYALLLNTSGVGNTANGAAALQNNKTGSNNTAIGYFSDVSVSNLSNATAIGSGAIVNASNKIRLGNTLVTVIEGQVAYTFPSDRTRKENFRDVDAQAVLEKLRRMDVTSWNYIGHDPKEFRHYGPMAQDFYAAFGHDEVGAVGTDTTINSGDIVGILMIGLKGLDAQVQKDQGTIAAQAARIVDLEGQTAEIASLKQQLAGVTEALKALGSGPGITRASQVAGSPGER